jgi:hypothetical protein
VGGGQKSGDFERGLARTELRKILGIFFPGEGEGVTDEEINDGTEASEHDND